MEMHQIRYFLAICETLNFTRAAERCHVTQPALTRAIQKLEEEVGGLLFRRERSSTHLTHLGQLMEPHLRQVLADSQAAITTARSFLTNHGGSLKLGVMCTIGPLRFVGFLSHFQQSCPDILVSMTEAIPDRLCEMLKAEEVEVAVASHPHGFDDRFHAIRLYRERYVVALPPGHRLERKNAVSVVDLGGESYLSRANCEYYDYLSDICRERQVQMRDAYRSEQEDWIQSMVLAGMGICFLPEYLPVLPGVQTRPLIEPEVTRDVVLLTVAGRRYTQPVESFVKAIRRYVWPSVAADQSTLVD